MADLSVLSRPVRAIGTRRPDLVGMLTLFVVLLLGVPAQLVFGPLGAAGTPAQLVGMVLLLWWVAYRLARIVPEPRTSQPLRRALLFFALALLVSYVAATTRAIDGVELRAADRGMLSLCAWSGIMLAASEAVPSPKRLDRLLRLVVLGGATLALIGITQFYTGFDLARYLQVPGLTANGAYGLVLARDDFRRPAATATHPIEFGVVLSMILPLALHYARHGGGGRLRRWLPVGLIALALPISVSRSAIVGAGVVLVFLLPTWPKASRRRTYAVLFSFLVLVWLTIPGLLGTLRNLFLGIFDDSSSQSRTGSYGVAEAFIEKSPIFGRGVGTFLPSYRILDNQYLITVIEAGVVGLVALVTLFVTAVLTARATRRRIQDPAARNLAQSLAAAAAASAVTFATFDALSFPMVAGLTFLVFGCIGAMWQIYVVSRRRRWPGERDGEPARPAAPRPGDALWLVRYGSR